MSHPSFTSSAKAKVVAIVSTLFVGAGLVLCTKAESLPKPVRKPAEDVGAILMGLGSLFYPEV
jgi:hypothetical protein